MAYSRGTGTPMNPYAKTARTNPNRVGPLRPIPSTGAPMHVKVAVNRKPGRNKATR